MFTHRHSNPENAFLSAVAVLLLIITAGQSATLPESLQPTNTTALTDSTTTQLNSSMEEPQVLRMYNPCPEEYETYCENGGQCMYPQDSNTPSCICQSSYHGPRCLLNSLEVSHGVSHCEQMIAISMGMALLILVLAIIVHCCVHRRCSKSVPLIKPAASESSV